MTNLTTLVVCYILGIVSSFAITLIYLWHSDFSLLSLLRCLISNNHCNCQLETANIDRE